MTEKEVINEIYRAIETEIEWCYVTQYRLEAELPELTHRIKGLDKARMIVLEISKKSQTVK
jgi:hypothetical protein